MCPLILQNAVGCPSLKEPALSWAGPGDGSACMEKNMLCHAHSSPWSISVSSNPMRKSNPLGCTAVPGVTLMLSVGVVHHRRGPERRKNAVPTLQP